jgi:hypothetical protein
MEPQLAEQDAWLLSGGGQAQTSFGTVLVVEQRGRDSIGNVRWGRTSTGNAEGRTATLIVTDDVMMEGNACHDKIT